MKHHWRYDKILTLEQAAQKAEELRAQGKKIITANGGFDILHAGHLDLLEEAKQQGDILMIGLNSDASLKEGKGESRPLVGEQERAALLAALACVDYVIIIDAPYHGGVPDRLLRAVKPTMHANGAEYGPSDKWIEWPTMHELGIAGYSVERRPGSYY